MKDYKGKPVTLRSPFGEEKEGIIAKLIDGRIATIVSDEDPDRILFCLDDTLFEDEKEHNEYAVDLQVFIDEIKKCADTGKAFDSLGIAVERGHMTRREADSIRSELSLKSILGMIEAPTQEELKSRCDLK